MLFQKESDFHGSVNKFRLVYCIPLLNDSWYTLHFGHEESDFLCQLTVYSFTLYKTKNKKALSHSDFANVLIVIRLLIQYLDLICLFFSCVGILKEKSETL